MFRDVEPTITLKVVDSLLEVHVSCLSLKFRFPPQGAIVFEVLLPSSNTLFCSRGSVFLLEKPPQDIFPSLRSALPIKVLTPSSKRPHH